MGKKVDLNKLHDTINGRQGELTSDELRDTINDPRALVVREGCIKIVNPLAPGQEKSEDESISCADPIRPGMLAP